jgi:subtilisin-like proprotein convertase family protein
MMNTFFPPPRQRKRLIALRFLTLLALLGASQVLLAQYTWVGNSTDWYDTGNYAPVPGSMAALVGNTVTIPAAPAGGNFPATQSGSPITMSRLNVQPGATATIPVGLQIIADGGGAFGVWVQNNASLLVQGEMDIMNATYGLANYGGTVTVNGTMLIDDVSSGGIYNNPFGALQASVFTNNGDISIGTSGSAGTYAIRNNGNALWPAEFTNNGMIAINNPGIAAILNTDGLTGTFFENYGNLNIFAAGVTGIRNLNDATFQNLNGGSITLDNAFRAIWQTGPANFFNDGASISINSNFATTDVSFGIRNETGAGFVNSNNASIIIGDVLQTGISNANALFQNINATIDVARSAEYGIITTTVLSQTTFINRDGGHIRLCQNGTSGFSALRNAGMSTFLNGDLAGNTGAITIEGAGQDAIMNDWVFANGPGGSTINIGQGLIGGCAATPVTRYGINNSAGASFMNHDLGQIAISNTANHGIRNAGTFANLNAGGGAASIIIAHTNPMSAGVQNIAGASFNQSDASTLAISGTALYGFWNNGGLADNTTGAAITISAGSSAGWLNGATGSLTNDESATINITNTGLSNFDNNSGTVLNTTDASIQLANGTTYGLLNRNAGQWNNGNVDGSGALTVFAVAGNGIQNQDLGTLISNVNCSTIETDSKITNDAPFINDAILKTTFAGVNMGTVPVTNNGIIIDVNNAFDSDITLRTANPLLVDNTNGVIAAPVYACATVDPANPVIIPQPLIASGAVTGKTFQTQSDWFADLGLTQDAGNYSAAANVFTYDVAFNPPNGGTDILYFNVGGTCSFTGEIHINVDALPEVQLMVDRKNMMGIPAGAPVTIETNLNNPYPLTICSGEGVQLDLSNLGPLNGNAPGNPPLYIEVVFTDPDNIYGGSTSFTFPGSTLPIVDLMAFPITNNTGAPAILTGTVTPYWESDGIPADFNPATECAGGMLSIVLTVLPDPIDLVSLAGNETNRRICSEGGFDLDVQVDGLPTGVSELYFEWEITEIGGPSGGPLPFANGQVSVETTNCGFHDEGATGQSASFTGMMAGILSFDGSDVLTPCSAPVLTLSNASNQFRRVEYRLRPVLVTAGGDICPSASTITYDVFIYPRPQAELDNIFSPVDNDAADQGDVIAICNATSPNNLIRVRQWPTVVNEAQGEMGDLEYDWSIALPAGILAAGATNAIAVGSDGIGVSKTDFISPITGLPVLTNTTTMPLDVTISLTPYYDPVNANAAGLPANLDPDGRCAGTTQSIVVTVLPEPDLDPALFTDLPNRIVEETTCGNEGLLPANFTFLMDAVNTNMMPWQVEFELYAVDMSGAPNVTRSTTQTLIPDGGHPNTTDNTNGHEVADAANFTEYVMNNGPFTETIIYTFRPQIDVASGVETEFCYGPLFTIELTVYPIPTASVAPAMPAYVCKNDVIDVIGVPGGYPPVPFPGSHLWEVVNPQPVGFDGTGSFTDLQAAPGGQSTTSQTGRLLGITPGTIRLQYTWTDGNGCTIREPIFLDVDILPAPATNPIVGSNMVCPQAITAYTITNDLTPGNTYTWSLASGGTIISSHLGPDITVEWNASLGGPHELSVIETGPNGCDTINRLYVSIVDMSDPAAMCPADITVSTQDDGTYDCLYTTPDMNLDVNPSDNCGIASATHNYNGGGVTLLGQAFPQGDTDVTWTVTDISNNVMTCSFTITVVDDQDPRLTCPPDVTVNADGTGLNVLAIVAGATVNGSPQTGILLNTYGADASDNCNLASLTWSAPTAGPNAGAGDMNNVLFTTGVAPANLHTVTYTATDGEGQAVQCSFTVQVLDNEAPVISCPANATVDTDADVCTYTVPNAAWNGVLIFDNSLPVSWSNSFNGMNTLQGAALPKGVNQLTWTATDAVGNTATCTFAVTVEDNQPPVTFFCPADFSISVDQDLCSAIIYYTIPIFEDNCDGQQLGDQIQGFLPGEAFPLGATPVEWNYTDVANNGTAECNFTVTVVDDQFPLLSCPPDVTVDADGTSLNPAAFIYGVAVDDASMDCAVILIGLEPQASDNCPNPSLSWEINHVNLGITTGAGTVSGQEFNGSVSTVTYTYEDGSGNTETCAFTVTVNDVEAPYFTTCSSNKTLLTSQGPGDCMVILPDYTSEVTADDLCQPAFNSVITITQQPAANDILTGAQGHIITFTAEDGSGNTATCAITVTVEDDVNPVAMCAAPFTVQLNGSNYTLAVDDIDDGSSDDCGISNRTIDPSLLTCAQAGTTVVVTLTVQDAAGNQDQCTTEVTVEDDQAPVIVKCPSNIMVGNDVDRCGAYVNWSPLHITDNCDAHPGTWYWLEGATIAGGNDIADLFGMGDGDTDNDPIPGTSSGDVFNEGVTTVTFIAIDASNNVSAPCSFTVTVNDTQLPVLIECPADRTVSTEADVCFGLVPDLTAEMIAEDNCPLEFTQDPVAATQFGSAHGEVLDVTVTATDPGNHQLECIVKLTLIDTQAPVITVCPADRDILTNDGTCQGTVPDLLSELDQTDNCIIVNRVQQPAAGSLFGSAHNEILDVRMIVFDAAGNSDTCFVALTLKDNQKPEILNCPADVTVNSNINCQVSLADYLANLQYKDNCTVFSAEQIPPAGTIFGSKNGGQITVRLIITDQAGNDSLCVFTVTQNPSPAPTVSLPNASYCLGEAIVPVQASSAVPGATFFWYTNPQLTVPVNPSRISGLQNQFYTPVSVLGTQTVYVVATFPGSTCTSDATTVTTIIYNCGLQITDPCSCKNNATTLFNGQFDEVIQLVGPVGQTWTITAVSGLFHSGSPAPPAQGMPVLVGQTLTMIAPGVYELTGIHVDSIGYSLTVSNGQVSRTVSNTCYYPNPTITGVFDNYCINYPAVPLIGSATYPGVPPSNIPFPAVQQTAQFDLLNNMGVVVQSNINQLVPANLLPGQYTLRYTFNAADNIPNAAYPGCTQVLRKTIDIFQNPPQALNCNNKGNVSLGTDGTATITADDILEGSYGCYDQYQVMITGKIDNVVDCDDVGKTFEVKVVDPITGNSCWGKILVEDKLAPVVICTDVTVSCNNDGLTPNLLGYPTVTDNCGPDNVTLTYGQTLANLTCHPIYDEIISRIWYAKDKTNGMTSSCTQQIFLKKGTLAEVVFPANRDDISLPSLPCHDADLSTSNTGYPQIDGLNVGGYCEMAVNYEDKTLPICEGSYKVSRTWMVMDKCTNSMIMHTQTIVVSDKQGPAFTCPAPDQVLIVNPAWNGCGARIFAPTINITDNCTLPPGIDVQTSILAGGILQQLPGNGGFFNVPYGQHTLRYTATDLCGNISSCTVNVQIEDTAPPTAVCNDNIVVSLIDEITYVYAETFDDGSHDNCAPKINYLVRRMDNPNCPGNDATDFAPTVPFYCCDVTNGPVTAVLKVFVDKNHNGLQDANEPANECMLSVTVQDKIKPVIQCPADITIACLEDLSPQDPGTLTQVISPNKPISAAYAYTYRDTINIVGLPSTGKILDLNALVTMDHELVDQLLIKLISPAGTEMVLFNGGNCGVAKKNMEVVFDDQGNPFFCGGFPTAISGILKPQGAILSIVNGQNPNGKWIFEVTDKAPLGAGLIKSLGIELTYGTPLAVRPIAFDNASDCVLDITYTDLDVKNQCAAGQVIRRQWQVTDPSGNTATCLQRITLEDNLPLIVDFPEDVTITDCTSLNDLTATGEPEHNGDCELVGISAVDDVYDVVPGACYKVVRTWTVVNWCLFNQNNQVTEGGIVLNAPQHLWQDDGDGYFKYVQTIKVIDNVAPVLTCPADTIIPSFASDCAKNTVAITLPAQDGCTPQAQLKSTWTIDLFNNGNTDISGTGLTINRNDIPLGTHRASFNVSDGCGNYSTCAFLFTVRDAKKPTPICITGLSVDLMPMTGEVSVAAIAFESGDSYDNCTAHENLQFRIERFVDIQAGQTEPGPNSGTSLIFDCIDYEGGIPVFVGLWVGDEAGNWDLCITYIIVQNNMGAPCAGNVTGSIYGKVKTELDADVEDVKITLSGTNAETMSAPNGWFNFPPMPPGGSYAVVPEKDDKALNGVSTYDILLIQKHLLGIKTINSPYCLIAADVNKTGTISVADIITLRKTLLTAGTTFQDNTSWRFVDKAFVFPNAKNPWQSTFPEIVNVNPLSGPTNVDFVGIKIGDISGDAKTTSLVNVETRGTEGMLALWTEDQVLEPGAEVTIPVHMDVVHGLEGFQFTLSFDPVLEFIGLEEGNLNEDNLGFRFVDDGLITVSWNDEWNPEQDVFHLKFRARDEGLLSQMLAIHSTILTAEAYVREGSDHAFTGMELQFRNAEKVDDGLALYQNIPNPFNGHTMIGFNLPTEGQAMLIIHDVSGREVKRIVNNYNAGFHQVELLASDLPGAGMYYYTLQFQGRQLTRRMSLLK